MISRFYFSKKSTTNRSKKKFVFSGRLGDYLYYIHLKNMLYQHHFGYVLQIGYRMTQIYFFIKIPALLNFATIGFPYSQAKRAGLVGERLIVISVNRPINR